MAIIREKKRDKFKKFWTRYSKFTKAAFVLVLALFVLCACTIGGFNGGGGSCYIAKGESVYFYLDYQNGKTLDKVYLNMGSAYTEVGSAYTVELRSASASTTSSSASWSSSYGLGKVTLANIWSDEETAGSNYNWVQVRDMGASALTAARRVIRLTASCDMLVNEVVFVDTEGNVIPAYVEYNAVRGFFNANSSYNWDVYGTFFRTQPEEVKNLVDAQHKYTEGDTAYSNFTQDEMYTLMQIENIVELGGRVSEESVYNADTDHGGLAVLPYVLSTLLFGRSAFGLRIVSVLFTAATVWMVWLLARELFARGDKKQEGWAFLTACLFTGGGLALTVGRLGLYLPMLAFLIVGSFYFMYRFFDRGISAEKPAKSACNILVSGLLFALAVAADPKMLLAGVGIVALFIAGAVRLERAYAAKRQALRAELRAANGQEASREAMLENAAQSEKRAAELAGELSYARRLVYILFFAVFAVGTFLLVVLTALPSFSVFARLYEANASSPQLGIFTYIGRMFGDAFTLTNTTAYSAGNALNAFGWFLGLKGATLFSATGEETYIALNAQLNIAMALTALIGFLFLSAYAIAYAVTGGKKGAYATERTPVVLRAYFVLLAGLVSSLLPYLFAGQASTAHALLFCAFYLPFIPLMFYAVSSRNAPVCGSLFGMAMTKAKWVLAALSALYAVLFVLTVPMVFCVPLSVSAAAGMFGWTSFINNGWYRM